MAFRAFGLFAMLTYIAFALPQEPALQSLDVLVTSTTTTVPTYDIPALLEPRVHPLTAHNEQSVTALALPTVATAVPPPPTTTTPLTTAYTTSTEGGAVSNFGYVPQTAHEETPEPSILVPATTQLAIASSSSTVPIQLLPVYVPHIEKSMAQSQAATIPAAVAIVAGPTTSLYTSAGSVYSTVVPAVPLATVSSPAVLRFPQSDAVEIRPGSAPVTIDGTTYSVAAGGSAIYINGMSSSLSAYDRSSWTTTTQSSGSAVSTAGAGASSARASTSIITSSTTATSSPTAKSQVGAGLAVEPCIWTAGLSIILAALL